MVVEKLGPKWIQVDLDQWEANLKWIGSRVSPAKVMPVIKANAYGHGLLRWPKVVSALDWNGWWWPL